MTPQSFTLKDRDGFTRTWEPTPSGHVRYSYFTTGRQISVQYVPFAEAMERIFAQGKNAEILEIKVS